MCQRSAQRSPQTPPTPYPGSACPPLKLPRALLLKNHHLQPSSGDSPAPLESFPARAVRNNEQRRGEFTVRGSPLGWARAGLPLPVVPRRPLPCCFLREPSLGKSLPSHASASGKETRSKVLAAQCHPHPLPAWPGGGPRPARTPGSQHRAEGRRHLGEWGRASGWGGAHGEENRGGSPWVDLKDPGAQARSAWRGEGLGGGLAATTSAFESDHLPHAPPWPLQPPTRGVPRRRTH